MALYAPGGPAGSGPSGKIGGMVFSHNRFGSYIRALVIPTNPDTSGQQLARNRLASLTNHWINTLTALQRASWETYAANVPKVNRIGGSIFLTGLNWYVAMNSLRLIASGTLARVDVAPETFSLAAYEITGITASAATQLITLAYTAGDNWEKDDGGMFVFATRPQNASINFNRLSYRYADWIEGDTAVPPASPQTVSAPFIVAENQKIWVRINVVEADARIGPSQIYPVTVDA